MGSRISRIYLRQHMSEQYIWGHGVDLVGIEIAICGELCISVKGAVAFYKPGCKCLNG